MRIKNGYYNPRRDVSAFLIEDWAFYWNRPRYPLHVVYLSYLSPSGLEAHFRDISSVEHRSGVQFCSITAEAKDRTFSHQARRWFLFLEQVIGKIQVLTLIRLRKVRCQTCYGGRDPRNTHERCKADLRAQAKHAKYQT
jgi:hypothetical protein